MQQPSELTFNGVIQLALYVARGHVDKGEDGSLRILGAKADPEWVQGMQRLIEFAHVVEKDGRFALTADGRENLRRALPAGIPPEDS